MGLTFLKDYNARRAGPGDAQADLFGDLNPSQEDEDPDVDTVNLDYEVEPDLWKPIPTSQCNLPQSWHWRPLRFVDGKDVARTAAWMRAPCGQPVPLRAAFRSATASVTRFGTCDRECRRARPGQNRYAGAE